MTTYTIERKLNREWDSIWQPLETFEDKELADWQKITKPVYTDYPTLSDSANMNRLLEGWESVSKVHQLATGLPSSQT